VDAIGNHVLWPETGCRVVLTRCRATQGSTTIRVPSVSGWTSATEAQIRAALNPQSLESPASSSLNLPADVSTALPVAVSRDLLKALLVPPPSPDTRKIEALAAARKTSSAPAAGTNASTLARAASSSSATTTSANVNQRSSSTGDSQKTKSKRKRKIIDEPADDDLFEDETGPGRTATTSKEKAKSRAQRRAHTVTKRHTQSKKKHKEPPLARNARSENTKQKSGESTTKDDKDTNKFWAVKEVLAYTNGTKKGEQVQLQWEDDSVTWEPLENVTKDLAPKIAKLRKKYEEKNTKRKTKVKKIGIDPFSHLL